jgi:hypothetical protein
VRLHGSKRFLEAFQSADLTKAKSVSDSETVSLGQVREESRSLPIEIIFHDSNI